MILVDFTRDGVMDTRPDFTGLIVHFKLQKKENCCWKPVNISLQQTLELETGCCAKASHHWKSWIQSLGILIQTLTCETAHDNNN